MRLATNLARVMLREHRPLDARPWLETGLAYAAEHEFELGMYRLLALRAIAWLQLGQWDEAERGLRELLDTRRDPGIAVSHVLAALGRLLVRRGSEEGDTLLRRAREVGERTGEAQRVIEAGLGLVEGAWLAGDRRAARELAAAPLEAARRRGLVHAQGELLTYLGRAGERVAGFAECPEPFAAGLAGRWQDAAEGWRRRGNPYEQALELAASGAQDPTVEALGVLDGIGSGATGRVVRRQLRDLGVTRIPRGPAPATRENPGGLTQRQLDVLTLLGEGLSNAEIAARLVVSVRTVDHHVSAILAKLGLTSRRDARSAVAGLGVRSRP